MQLFGPLSAWYFYLLLASSTTQVYSVQLNPVPMTSINPNTYLYFSYYTCTMVNLVFLCWKYKLCISLSKSVAVIIDSLDIILLQSPLNILSKSFCAWIYSCNLGQLFPWARYITLVVHFWLVPWTDCKNWLNQLNRFHHNNKSSR